MHCVPVCPAGAEARTKHALSSLHASSALMEPCIHVRVRIHMHVHSWSHALCVPQVHTTPHIIYLSRHGQSEYNVLGKIGGNPPLSKAGEDYALRLGDWVPEHICKHQASGLAVKARLWTSSLQRTILTASHIPHPMLKLSQLVDAGGIAGPDAVGASESAGASGCPSPFLASSPASASPIPDCQLEVSTVSTMRQSRMAELNEDIGEDELWEQMSPRVYRNLDEIFAVMAKITLHPPPFSPQAVGKWQ